MRVEGEDEAGAATFGGAPLDALDDLEMSPMQPVEVAERKHRRSPMHGPRLVRVMDYVHLGPASMLNESPS